MLEMQAFHCKRPNMTTLKRLVDFWLVQTEIVI